MLNAEEERILNGIKYGLREELPSNTDAIRRYNVLKAIELDRDLELGIFDVSEVAIILDDIKQNYINNNREIKTYIKKNKR